jgi:hypothetical protein
MAHKAEERKRKAGDLPALGGDDQLGRVDRRLTTRWANSVGTL